MWVQIGQVEPVYETSPLIESKNDKIQNR